MLSSFTLPKDCDFTIHDSLSVLENSLVFYKNRLDIPQFVFDDLSEKVSNIFSLLYEKKVGCAIPCFQVFEKLADNFYLDDIHSL